MSRRHTLKVLAGILMALAPATAFADFNVSGRFMYVDREFDGGGFTGLEPLKPIRFADVQVIDGSKIIGVGVTDGNGNFVFGIQDSRARDIYVRCLARHQTSIGIPIDVRSGNQSGTIWSIRTQTFLDHQPDQDLFIGTMVAVPEAGGEAFNLLDNALLGADYIKALRGPGPAPLLLIVFNAANPNLSSTTGNTIIQARNAGYDDTVLLHEMGHYVVSNFSKSDSNGGTHRLSDCNQNIVLAFDEGHATAWGLSVRRFFNLPHSNMYVRTTGQPGPGNLQFSFDIETQLPFVCRGSTSETTVYAALWDLLDGPSTTDDSPGTDEAWDLLVAREAEYWAVMTSYLPTATNISLEDFWDGWFHPTITNGFHTEMISIFRELGVEYSPDASEPNDLTSEARMLFPGSAPLHLTFFADRDFNLLGEPDVDLFTFSAVPGATYTIETLNLLSDANTELELRASDGSTVLASNNDRDPNDASSLIIYTATEAGLLYVRSRHATDFGIYGSYDLRVEASGGGVDADMDGYTTATDCDDTNPAVHPQAIEVCNGIDDNCDAVIDEGFDKDDDGFKICEGDCNDANAGINPGAPEVCNSIDDDCDGLVDEGFDGDGDGFTPCGGDCNDTDPMVHPNQPELCNGFDDDCNGLTDEEFDDDLDGVTVCAGDCDDANPLIFPGQIEACNGIDDNCDTIVDEGFPDTDLDGLLDCLDPDDDNDGVPDALDCAPLTVSISELPGEILSEVFLMPSAGLRLQWEMIPQAHVYNLYRGEVTVESGWAYHSVCLFSETADVQFEDAEIPAPGRLFYYLEAGTNLCGEGSLGSSSSGQARPLAQPCAPQGRDSDTDGVIDLSDNCPLMSNVGQSDVDRDSRGDQCDNCPQAANPAQRDADANGLGDVCQDLDDDGFTADLDCNDADPLSYPGAVEVCDRADNDCNGVVDEGFDLDGDGYTFCGGDCEDGIPEVHPGAVEIFNGVDDDCNGLIDDVYEELVIVTATYDLSRERLLVEAVTNYPPGSVTLSVEGFGTMSWVASSGVYRLAVQPTSDPGSVTVTSTAGGSATAPVLPF